MSQYMMPKHDSAEMRCASPQVSAKCSLFLVQLELTLMLMQQAGAMCLVGEYLHGGPPLAVRHSLRRRLPDWRSVMLLDEEMDSYEVTLAGHEAAPTTMASALVVEQELIDMGERRSSGCHSEALRLTVVQKLMPRMMVQRDLHSPSSMVTGQLCWMQPPSR